MIAGALAIAAVGGLLAAFLGGVGAGVLIAVAVNFSAAVGKLAFESIVQRDAPQANRGRAFARFETRFQLAWVVAGVIPVLIVIPGWAGFLVVGIVMGLDAAELRRRQSRSSVRVARQAAVPRRPRGRRPSPS